MLNKFWVILFNFSLAVIINLMARFRCSQIFLFFNLTFFFIRCHLNAPFVSFFLSLSFFMFSTNLSNTSIDVVATRYVNEYHYQRSPIQLWIPAIYVFFLDRTCSVLFQVRNTRCSVRKKNSQNFTVWLLFLFLVCAGHWTKTNIPKCAKFACQT